MSDALLVLTARDIRRLLLGREREMVDAVRLAYEAHARGQTSLPHSSFLRFPDQPRDRIIALPAFLGGDEPAAGIKWIASFPGNLERGQERASAVMILNSVETGRPTAILESSLLSASRTAASAALAAERLSPPVGSEAIGLVGCGLINRTVLQFLVATRGSPATLVLHDSSRVRAEAFAARCGDLCPGTAINVVDSVAELARSSRLISFATTALAPHVGSEAGFAAGSTVLHVSLRDLQPELILGADNTVDDVDHVCRAETSIHLAEQQAGDRAFIRGTLGDILLERIPARRSAGDVAVFSPFGLGILDLAVAALAVQYASHERAGTHIEGFLPGV